jgi:hypothetical protein
MGYLLAGLLVLLIVGAVVTLVARSARRQGRTGRPGSEAGILATDRDSPLGDTSEHSGSQRDGETVPRDARGSPSTSAG